MSAQNPISLRSPIVVIATKGRPTHVAAVVRKLERQTLPPACILIVGTSSQDLPTSEEVYETEFIRAIVAPKVGLSCQRNVGLDWIQGSGFLSGEGYFSAFFDDDFIPADTWLERAALAFRDDPSLAGLTGHVLADGVNGAEISLADAERFLSGDLAPSPHWSAVVRPKAVESLYGCNMAFRGDVAAACRFDEALPLYSWQEDCDYSGQAQRFGKTMIIPACKGVHLGVKSGRISGVRMGYSQIANPIRIASRRNMPPLRAVRFVSRALAANLIRSAQGRSTPDYPGRLKGNLLALTDIVRLKLDSRKILDL
jgi:glycosyltransferase involved in cell wall biosynthesis